MMARPGQCRMHDRRPAVDAWYTYMHDIHVCKRQAETAEHGVSESDADDTNSGRKHRSVKTMVYDKAAVRRTLALVAPGWVTTMPSPKAMGSGPMPLVSWNRMAEPRPLLSAVRGAPCIIRKQ